MPSMTCGINKAMVWCRGELFVQATTRTDSKICILKAQMSFFLSGSGMLILLVLSLVDKVLSQSVTFLPEPTECVGPPVTMSSCSAFFSIESRCAAITSGQASAASCYCLQSVRDKLGEYGEWPVQ